MHVQYPCSLVPKPTQFYLPFASTVIHKSGLIFTNLRIIVNTNRRSKRRRPGTEARLHGEKCSDFTGHSDRVVDKQFDKLIALLCTCTYGMTNVVPPARAVTMAEVLSLHVKGSHGRWMEHCLMILHIPQTNFNSSKQVLVKFSKFCEANGTYIYITSDFAGNLFISTW